MNRRLRVILLFALILTVFTGASLAGAAQAAQPDLVPSITGGPLTDGASGPVTVTITNTGGAAENSPVVVTITVPDGVALNSFSSTSGLWGCVPGTLPLTGGLRNIVCTLPGGHIIAGPGSDSIVLTVTPGHNVVVAGATFLADISPGTTPAESNTANNTVSQNISVTGVPDLAIVTSHLPSQFTIGTPGTFTITATNNGSLAANPLSVTVHNSAPVVGLTLSGPAPAGWTCTITATTYSCQNNSTIPAFGAAPALILNATATGAPGTRTLTSHVDAVGEPAVYIGTDNDSSDTVQANGAPDFSIVKTSDPSFTIGSTGTYTLNVTNGGAGPATHTITVTDTLPANLTLASSSSSTDFVCSGVGTANVSCVKNTQFAPGSATITLIVNINAGSGTGIPLGVTNSATVTTSDDSNNANNTSAPLFTPVKTVDLMATKAAYFAVGSTFVVDSAGTLDQGYNVTITNNGTASTAATTATFTDTLPGGLTFVSDTVSGTGSQTWTCAGAGTANVSCTATGGTLATGQTSILKLRVKIPITAFPSVTNSTAVVGYTGDVNPADNTAPSVVTPVHGVNLSIAKTHSGDFTATVPGTYTIVVTNSGTADTGAGTVSINDTVPTGVTYNHTGSGGTGWACPVADVPGPTVINCTYALNITAAGGTSNALSFIVTSTSGSNFTNNVTAVFVDDVDLTNNSTSDPTVVQPAPSADLAISKSITTPFTAGSPGVYTITVQNVGSVPTSAGTIIVQDTLPAAPNFGAFTFGGTFTAPANCTLVTNVVTCTRAAAINNGSSFTITIQTTPATTGTPPNNNTAALTSAPGDNNNSNNSVTINTPIAAAATPDLTISKTHSGSFFVGAPAGSAHVLITVTNVGGLPTTGATVTVTDAMPAGLNAAGYVGNGIWTCVVTGTDVSGQTITCTGSQAVPTNASYPVIDIPLTIDGAVLTPPPAVTQTNTATIASNGGGGESNFANNTASDTITVTAGAQPDLTITKTHSGNFTTGASANYSITVSNVGSGATNVAQTISVTDTLPTGLTYTGSSGGSGFICPGGPIAGPTAVVCTRAGSLANGASLSPLIFTVTPTIAGSVTNSVTVGGINNDSNPANNSASDPTTIIGAPDLSITKTHAPALLQAGVPGSYTITVTNVGTATTPGGAAIQVTDSIDANLTINSVNSGTFACNTVGQTVTCNRANVMAPTNSATITINVTPILGGGSFPKNFTNSASVTIIPNPPGPNPDLNPTNDTANDATTITNGASFDLQLTKTHSPATFLTSSTGTYTLVVKNVGTANYTGGAITVVDNLPGPNIVYSSFTSNGPSSWNCVNASGTVTCTTNTTLNPNNSTSVTINVTTGAAANVTNNASINPTAAGDPNTANDSASDPTTISSTPTVSAANSCVQAVPNAGLNANNTDVSVVSVVVRDGTNNPVTGLAVTLNNTGIIVNPATPQSGTSNGSGVASFNERSANVGNATFSALAAGVTITNACAGQSATASFGGSSVNGVNLNNSSVSASPTSLAADGVASSTVSVHLADNNNLSLAGVGITLTYTTNTGNTTGITPASGTTGTTDSSGNATFSLKSTTNQIVTITISGTFNSAGFTLTQHPAVTFGTGGTSTTATTASSTVTGNFCSIPADLVTTTTITVTLKDVNGNGVSGKSITLAGTSSPVLTSMSISPASVVTDANGVALFTVRSGETGGPVTLTATDTTDGNLVLGQTVVLTFTKTGTSPSACANATLTPGVPSGAIVIARLLCIRTGPGFGYARYPSALKFNTPVTVLGKTTRVPGTAVRDNCIHIGGPTWFLMQIPGGGIVWGNANFVRIGRIAFRNLPVLPPPPAPGAAGAAQAAISGPVTSAPSGQPTVTPTAHP